MPDLAFDVPRLAQLYDPLDPDRSDLDVYADMVIEFDVRSVLDVGCGTGTFACLLASRGVEVIAVDPAGAMLDVARSKPGADQVRWLHADATSLPSQGVEAAFMTGNVAQVFLTDAEWEATLRGCHRALGERGRLVFEVRDPSQRAWEQWTRTETEGNHFVPGIGWVHDWIELRQVRGELVTFSWTVRFESDGAVFRSDSTLRFRPRQAIESSLKGTGFILDEVRDAPDRPGLEWVFIARRLP
jgi:SAM-dependent methyltransferase